MAITHRVRGMLLPTNDTVDLFIRDGLFVAEPPPGDEVITLHDGGALTPGLVDAHAHLQMASPAPDGSTLEQVIAASARAQLDAGVLALREPGGPAGSSMGLGPEHGLPRALTAGRFLAPPDRYIPGLAREVTAEELPDAAVDELSRAAGWAKVVGDWMSPDDGRITPNFAEAALAETARRVHEAGGRLAIHAALTETIERAVSARVDSVEHGLGLTPALAERMAVGRIAFTPTAIAMMTVPDFMSQMGAPSEDVRWWSEVVERFPQTIRHAAEAGVRILAGTDSGMVAQGQVRLEIEYLKDAGLPSAQALGAGSWDARDFFGFPGVEIGAPADLVAYATDPREDLGALSAPALILLEGNVVGVAR